MDYLPHLSDSLRLSIAQDYVRHELRKLFPNLRLKESWETIDKDVGIWFSESPTMAPVRDFWNGVYGISMGFKLKDIVTPLTSLHMRWEQRDVEVDSLTFGVRLEDLNAFPPYPAVSIVRQWYLDPQHERELAALKVSQQNRTNITFFRDSSPIFVLQGTDGVLRVKDGNRRLLKAIVDGQKTLWASVGSPINEPSVHEHWVPTPLLISLVAMHRSVQSTDSQATAAIGLVIFRLIQHSSAGQFEFFHRSLSKTENADLELEDRVCQLLQKQR